MPTIDPIRLTAPSMRPANDPRLRMIIISLVICALSSTIALIPIAGLFLPGILWGIATSLLFGRHGAVRVLRMVIFTLYSAIINFVIIFMGVYSCDLIFDGNESLYFLSFVLVCSLLAISFILAAVTLLSQQHRRWIIFASPCVALLANVPMFMIFHFALTRPLATYSALAATLFLLQWPITAMLVLTLPHDTPHPSGFPIQPAIPTKPRDQIPGPS